jgi:putative transposase
VSDHIHCFIGLKPAVALSDLVRDIKNNSSKFVNENGFVKGKFQWQACLPKGSSARRQEGFGAFSYAHSQIEHVYNYILNQEEHHRKKTFKEEYTEFLNQFQIDHKPEYLFDWLE